MKMKIFILLLVSAILAGPATGASLSGSFDHSGFAPSFDMAGYVMHNSTDLSSADGGSVAVSPGLLKDVPVPTAAWLFMSGLVGLVGVSRRKKPRETRHA